jgi:integrase
MVGRRPRRGKLRIENTRTLVDGEMIEKETKSEKGTRALPRPDPVTAALKSFKATQAAEKLALGEGYADTGYVLVDELGEPVRTDWLRRRFNELMVAARVRRVRLYDARHACLTFLATNGVPDVIVSAWAPTHRSESRPWPGITTQCAVGTTGFEPATP